MLLPNNIDYNTLIQFSKDGIRIATYAELRSAVTARFKDIYGSDIDLSTSSADGIYVETYCLIINNILQSFQQMYSELDPRTANGVFLEILSSFSNISRKAATYSRASIVVTNNDTVAKAYHSIVFSDQNGNEWIWTSSVSSQTQEGYTVTFEPNVAQTLVVVCSTSGPVRADAGWINQTVEAINFSVSQTANAAIGSYAETDAQLRARRNDSLAAASSTVLEGLVGSLISVTGIDDAMIYNNDTDLDKTAKDGTTVSPHAVYILLRQKSEVDVSDQTIGTIIYNKMTPGIHTTTTNGTNGVAHTYNYDTGTTFIQTVNWKKCTAVHPLITIVITPQTYFASANNSTATKICTSILNYANKLKLANNLTKFNIQAQVTYADPLFRGLPTYSVNSITITGANSDGDFINQDTYFDYDIATMTVTDNSSTITITLGA